jgi:hypothetical protein
MARSERNLEAVGGTPELGDLSLRRDPPDDGGHPGSSAKICRLPGAVKAVTLPP